MEVSFSIIIPSRRLSGAKQLIKELIPQLLENDEILCCVDHEEEIQEFRNNRVLFLLSKGTGPAAARNTGIEAAKGNCLVFVDDDCKPSPNLLSIYRDLFKENPDLFCIGGEIIPEGKGFIPDYLRTQPWTWKHLSDCQSFVTCNLAIRNAGLRFDERFEFACEDMAFSLHLKGKKFVLSEKAWVRHRNPTDLAGFILMFYRYGKGLAFFREEYNHLYKGRERGITLLRTVRRYFKNSSPGKALCFAMLEVLKYTAYYLGYIQEKL